MLRLFPAHGLMQYSVHVNAVEDYFRRAIERPLNDNKAVPEVLTFEILSTSVVSVRTDSCRGKYRYRQLPMKH